MANAELLKAVEQTAVAIGRYDAELRGHPLAKAHLMRVRVEAAVSTVALNGLRVDRGRLFARCGGVPVEPVKDYDAEQQALSMVVLMGHLCGVNDVAVSGEKVIFSGDKKGLEEAENEEAWEDLENLADSHAIDAASLRLAAVHATAAAPQETVAAALTILALVRAGAARSPRQMFTPRRLAALAKVRLPATPGTPKGKLVAPAWLQEREWARDDLLPRLNRAFSPGNTAHWRSLPALTAAAAILWTWRDSGCEGLLGGAPGRVLATAWVRRAGLTAGSWFLPSLGFRGHGADWSPAATPSWPPRVFAAARRAAEDGLQRHRQLMRAREDLLAACQGRRVNSRMPLLADLLISRSALSGADVAKALAISPRAASGMIDELRQSHGGLVREITGRDAFRIYGIA